MVGIGQSIAVGVLLDHLNVHGVVDQQSRVVPVQGSVHVLGEVTEHAQLVRQRSGVQIPVGAHQALDGGIIAQGGQQHLGGLNGGHVGGGIKGPVAAAGDDVQGVAVIDIAPGPAVGDVGQTAVHAHVELIAVLVVAEHD